MSKIAYTIHHLECERDISVSQNILSKNMERIYSDTVLINGEKSLLNFTKQWPEFNLKKRSRLRYQEVGLWASTFLCLKEFIESKYQNILILEDDIELLPNFDKLFYNYFNSIPKNSDCFMLFVPEKIFYNSGYENLKDQEKYKTDNLDIWIAHQTWSTGCMIISRSGAEKILNYIYSGIDLPLDIFILGGSTLRNPKKNARILNVYSLSKNATRVTALKEYPSQIQNGKYVRL